MSASFSKPSLVNFYIFDSRYGQKEGEEHEKLLYYYPDCESLNTKIRNIGLSEAFTTFTNKFNKSSDCDTIHTQKHCTVMLQPEPNIWMVMRIALAWHIVPSESDATDKKSRRGSKSKKNSNKTDSMNVKKATPKDKDSTENVPTTNSEALQASNSRDDLATISSSTADDTIDNASENSLLNSSQRNAVDCSEKVFESSKEELSVSQNEVADDNISNTSLENSITKENLNDRSRRNSESKTQSGEDIIESSRDCDSANSINAPEKSLHAERNDDVEVRPSSACSSITPEPGSTVHYDRHSVQPAVLKGRLNTAYCAFAFLHYSFENVLNVDGLDALRNVLQQFFDDYLQCVDMTTGDVGDIWRGLSYLPLDQPTFLKVYSCLAGLRSVVTNVRHTALLWHSSVVWCDFDLETLRRLVHFMRYTGVLDSKSKDSKSSEGYAESFFGGVCSSTPVYIGPTRDVSKDLIKEIPQKSHLVLFRSCGVIIPIVLPFSEKLQPSLYERLFHVLDSRISQLSSDLLRIKARDTSIDGYKYVYHNTMNLAVKCNLLTEKPSYQGPDYSSDSKKSSSSGWWFSKSSSNNTVAPDDGSEAVSHCFGSGGGVLMSAAVCGSESNRVPWTVMQAMVDMQTDMERYDIHESVVKDVEDHWVIGRAGNGRHLFVSMQHSTANLVEVLDEVNRQCSSQFDKIFMLD